MLTIQSPPPIEKAIWLNKWALIGYIATLFIVAVMTFLSWWAGSHLQDVVQKEADARIKEAEARAAEALENAGKANERAGVANDSAAKANVRAQKLETDNLTLRGQVATLETQAAEAKKDVAGLQKAAADAIAAQQRVETALAKQQERTAIAERALLELQERVKDRQITPEKRARILELLSNNPKGTTTISFAANDTEAFNFAKQLAEVLAAAGWHVTLGNPSIESTSVGGVGIFVHGEHNPPAVALQRALGEVGFPAAGFLNPELPEEYVGIFVSKKP